MASDIPAIVHDDWPAISGSDKPIPMPFEHEILLLECHVAGTTHVDDIESKTADVDVGSFLKLVREPSNEHDSDAIAVLTTKDERIGWIPQYHNDVISKLMDGGKLLVAKVVLKEKRNSWTYIRVEVYLKDV